MSYPLPILNELHELYPDLLYRPARFQTSNHVIDYILEQSIHRVHREELARYQASHAPYASQVAQAMHVLEPVVQQAQAIEPQQVSQSQRQRNAIENFEREFYGAVVYRPEPSQATSFEQLLTSLIDDGIAQSRPQRTTLRPTATQLESATTVRTLTEHHDGVCSICHEEMVSGQHIRQIHHCSHVFHQFCIDTWFSMRSSCPTCRHDIRSN
jgi:hypothetical protein